MSDRAISSSTRRSTRRLEIIRAAQELAAERGYTGFTVDEIAERVGVSRRTLFNHIDSKESAVLGSLPELTPELTSRLGGEGDPFALTLDVAVAALDIAGSDIEDWRRLHEVLVANPELIPRVKERIEALSRELVEHLSTRSDVDPERARVILAAIVAVLQISVEDALDRPELGDISSRLPTNLALLREVLDPR